MSLILSKFKNLVILFSCVAKFIYSGKAIKKTANLSNILVVATSKLGDMVCRTPMFRAAKKEYPNSRLYVMGNEINKDLLAGNPNIDDYIVYQKKFFDLLRTFKKGNFDFACITEPNFTVLAALYLANIPLIAVPVIENGFSPYETRSYKIVRNFVVTKPYRMGSYAPREYLKLLEPIGIFVQNTEKYLYFSEAAEKRVINFLVSQNVNLNVDFLIGITPSAGNKIKEWSRDKFAKLANYIFDKYRSKIIIIGGPNDTEVDEMISFIGRDTKFINARGLFNIEELKALISKLNLFISVDTGPIYIAEAFSVPTIDIIGPIDEREQSPVGKFHKIAVAQRQKPELYVMNARVYNEKEAKRQIEAIGVEMVIDKFEELMKDINYHNPNNQQFYNERQSEQTSK